MMLINFLKLLAVFVLLLDRNSADKISKTVETSGVYGSYIGEDFGMARKGLITINYNVYSKYSELPYQSRAIVLIIDEKQREDWYSSLDDTGDLSSSTITALCNLPSMLRRPIFGTGTLTFEVTPEIGNDLFSVVLLQCKTGLVSNPVTLDLDVEYKNALPDSSSYTQLSITRSIYPRILAGELIVYGLFIVGLINQMVFGGVYVANLYYAFLGTVVISFIYIAIEYGDYQRYSEEGKEDQVFLIASNIFGALTSTALLATLLLLSLGWSVVRGSLSIREKRMISISLVTFLIFTVSDAVCLETTQPTCQALSLMSFILRSLILLGIIIAMNFTVTQLKSMLNHTPWVPSTPIQYARTKQYLLFRLIFVLYLLLPTAFLIIRVTLLSWKEDWIIFLLNELLTILMLMHIGATFGPLQETQLIRAFDGSINNANNPTNNQAAQNNAENDLTMNNE